MMHQPNLDSGKKYCPDTSNSGTADASLNLLFKLSSDLFAEVDFNGVFTRVNPAWSQALGYPIDVIKGQKFIDFVHPSDVARTVSLTVSILSGSNDEDISGSFKNRYRCSDGSYRWLAWSWATDFNNQRIVAIARDETKHKEREDYLQQSLNRTRASNEELQNFASVASHDLREPLRMVTNYLKLLQLRYPETLDQTARSYIETACEGADRMRTMLRDLLEYARLENRPPSPQKISLQKVFKEVLDSLSVAIREENATVDIQFEDAPVIIGSYSRIIRLFQNLLANAIKFHEPGVDPVVTVKFPSPAATVPNDICIIQIADQGIGIEPDHIPLIFNAFTRLNTREEFEGNGIGLASCKKIIDQHDGSIEVESQKGIGSTFTVQLKRSS